MLADVLSHLRCPVCQRPLALAPGGGTLACPTGHRFDLARQGYVSLTRHRVPHPGDSAAMVAARQAFLGTGAFDFVSTALADAAAGRTGLVLDAGAGTGHHLARVLATLPGTVGLAVDVSKPALRRAARAHPRIGAVLADTWQRLPVADRAAAVMLNVFAPRNGPEFARVLDPDGLLLVVTPTPAHLADLATRLGPVPGVRLLRVDPAKPAELAAELTPHFQLAAASTHTRTLWLPRADLVTLVAMGPSAAHTDPVALAAAVRELPEPVPVTASVRLARFVRARSGG